VSRFTYVGPYDSAEIIGFARGIKPGEAFDVPDDRDGMFLEQPDNFAPVTAKASAKANPAQEG
jgi:hypothetical protein